MIYYISPQLSIQDSRIQYCTEAQANKYLSTQKVLQVDTETTGLSFVDDTLLTLQVGTKDHQFVFDLRHKPELPLMKRLLESGNYKKLLHNVTLTTSSSRSMVSYCGMCTTLWLSKSVYAMARILLRASTAWAARSTVTPVSTCQRRCRCHSLVTRASSL